jgi:O-antigen ligase
MLVAAITFGGVLTILVITHPYYGVAFTAASLPILDLLPEIPYFSSIVPLIGAITIIGYLFKKRTKPFKFNYVYLFSLLFVAWIFVSNPQAAWFGSERNWFFTFIQLWALLFLSGELLDTPEKQKIVMLIFSISAVASAFYALQNAGQSVNFETYMIDEAGLTDNANAAARYFTIAMVFITYLRSTQKNQFVKVIGLLGIFLTYVGVLVTLSRTGVILLTIAQGLIIILEPQRKQKFSLVLAFSMALVVVFVFSENLFKYLESFVPAIQQGTDTVGVRYNLWRSGWNMWIDHPIKGVGIGMFINKVGPYIYQLEGPHLWRAVAHNTYIQVLSETGIVGFFLFMLLVFYSLRNLILSKLKTMELLKIRNVWLIVLMVMLIGGITKSDHADKLSWMVMGISVFFANLRNSVTQISTQSKASFQGFTTPSSILKELQTTHRLSEGQSADHE